MTQSLLPIRPRLLVPQPSNRRRLVVPDRTGAAALAVTVGGVEVVSLRWMGSVDGVRVDAVAGRNGPGEGLLEINPTQQTIRWRAPGSATFGAVTAYTGDGSYLARDGDDDNKWIRARLWTAHLPTVTQRAAVHLADRYNNDIAQADLSAAEATAGDVLDYELTLENVGLLDMLELRAWIDAETERIEISDDDVTYVSPDAEDHADVLFWARLEVNDTETLYVRRTIPASADSQPGVLTLLHFSWDGY